MKGQILIVEDISKDLVEFLGSSLNIDPLFFASHVFAAYRNTSMQTPDLALLPSRFQSQQYFNTHYHRTVQLRQKDECLGKKHLIRATNISRKLAILPPTHNISIGLAGLAPSRHGMLEDLIYYWNLKLPTDFDPTSPTLLSLCFYPLRIIAAEWANVLAVMNYHMKRYEYSVEGQRILSQDLDLLNTDLNSLQRWRRRNLSSQRKIDAISRFVTSQMASESQIDADVPRNNYADSDYLVSDYAHLTSRLNQYSQRLESMLPVVMSLVQISDSRRSLAEAANISRLTYLAFVFVPLSFASSLFSMNPDTSPGGNHFWVYFAVALPITGAAFFIARPPCSLRLWRNPRVKSGISEV
ncbi:hypothetical protein BGW36DRAFT_348443 [Talaromyces proteolyticus]|uniref:Uncharacterized protein n=1 Tax=Talaromyces proteolyticus TaxID=1131652 RepID=A0AAD4KI99_9EURO|nr:uncharacterized protein BGW36DRAFT_348443 [Talaromyces proteolyticus]KAH8692236.1 hypothetical protein BGW36DRAFT_348443 [Talaromyces proteolyticus]